MKTSIAERRRKVIVRTPDFPNLRTVDLGINRSVDP